MAKLHATMVNSRGKTVSTIAHRETEVMVETWQVRIATMLLADGRYTIVVSDRSTGRTIERYTGQYPQAG